MHLLLFRAAFYTCLIFNEYFRNIFLGKPNKAKLMFIMLLYVEERGYDVVFSL